MTVLKFIAIFLFMVGASLGAEATKHFFDNFLKRHIKNPSLYFITALVLTGCCIYTAISLILKISW